MAETREKILIIGAGGQIGTELTIALRDSFGGGSVLATDIREFPTLDDSGPFEILNVMDRDRLYQLAKDFNTTQIYNLAALLSAAGEKKPKDAWELNMAGLLNSLDAVRDLKIGKLFWPSSIAVFGPNTPRDHTPQQSIMDPNTVYGISKLAGERWCEYYHKHYGVDVRSLRYPGLIGYKSQPGGGTTDYAVDIFHHAVKWGKYTCFLKEDTALPMMYMADAIRATISLMGAQSEKLTVRSSYNLAGISFDPCTLAEEIKKHHPSFDISYIPDFRQNIADSWPNSIDDSAARLDWGWEIEYDLKRMVADMLYHIRKTRQEAENQKSSPPPS